MERHGDLFRPAVTIALGFTGAFIGMWLGVFGAIHVSNLDYFDKTTTTCALAGGGVGWFAGTCTGWRVSTGAPRPRAQTAWLLRALSLAVLASALIGELGARREQFDPTHPHLYALQLATIADAALIAITLFALSPRHLQVSSRRRYAWMAMTSGARVGSARRGGKS